jgi:hypothetical protein
MVMLGATIHELAWVRDSSAVSLSRQDRAKTRSSRSVGKERIESIGLPGLVAARRPGNDGRGRDCGRRRRTKSDFFKLTPLHDVRP